MARNPPIAVRNGQVPNQIAIDFSAWGAREDTQKNRVTGTVCLLSREKIWAARGSVAPDRKEETRKMEQEMRRILDEDEAERARGGGVDRAPADEKNILTLEEIDVLLSSDKDEEDGDRKRHGGDILTQEEIDALLRATEPADSDHAAEEVDDDFIAAMEEALEEALEELNPQKVEGERCQPKREEPSDPDVE